MYFNLSNHYLESLLDSIISIKYKDGFGERKIVVLTGKWNSITDVKLHKIFPIFFDNSSTILGKFSPLKTLEIKNKVNSNNFFKLFQNTRKTTIKASSQK